jgi:hypothetical protein
LVEASTILKRVFSEDFYLLAYPDVAKSGVDAWEHFSKHGLREGRWPNPFVDPEYISNQLGLPLADTLPRAFAEKKHWIINTSPYVDIRNFIISGMWNGEDHPLQQMLDEGHLSSPWLKLHLGFADLAPLEDDTARIKALAILQILNGNAIKFSTPIEVSVGELEQSEISFREAQLVTCVPGQFISIENVGYFISDHKAVLSKDNSVIYYDNRFAFFRKGAQLESKLLVLSPQALNREQASEWMLALGVGTIVAPFSSDQEHLLNFVALENNLSSVRILEFGVQAQISCYGLVVSKELGHSNRRVPGRLDYLRRKSILVISETLEELLNNQSAVMDLVARGASICISDNRSAKFWIEKFKHAKLVVTFGRVSWVDVWLSKSIPIISSRQWRPDVRS